MQEGQDWCLQCGTAKPRLFGGGPGWRTGIAILGTTAVLVCGAAVAAYAALNKTKPKPAVVAVVAKVSSTGVPATPTTPGAATTPGTTPLPGTPTTVKATPPKIPLQTPTPQSSSGADAEANNALFPPETKTGKSTKTTETTPAETSPTKTTAEPTKSTTESKETGSETKTSSEGEAPSPILLDTDAASVYNPYNYPASLFGDPGLAIDDEETTAWTAQVQATSAPKMAEGLLLDLKNPQKLGSVTVKTTTTGITVEVYGANGATPPTSISDPAW